MGGSGEYGRQGRETDPAVAHLDRLRDETMTLAWGSDKTPEDRRRIVLAASIFGRRFEERMKERSPEGEEDFQRFLMGLMNVVISEFAEHEGLDLAAATEFLSDVNTRDYVLEFDEVLEGFADEPTTPLDEHFRAAVESRREKAARRLDDDH